jgi:hypothetical protein
MAKKLDAKPVVAAPLQKPTALVDKADRPDMDAFETAMRRAAHKKGFSVSFDYSEDAELEVTHFWKEEQCTIILLAVKELLDGNFAHKLV